MKENASDGNDTGMCTKYKMFDLKISEELFT